MRSAQLVAVAAASPARSSRREPGSLDRVDRDPGQHGVRARRHRRPAQNDRVAGLDAERGAVDRDVRARLVDHRDDPIGTRTFSSLIPFGSVRSSTISPTGSGRAAMSRTSRAIVASRSSSSRAGRAATSSARLATVSMSRPFASRISADRSSSAVASASSARSWSRCRAWPSRCAQPSPACTRRSPMGS